MDWTPFVELARRMGAKGMASDRPLMSLLGVEVNAKHPIPRASVRGDTVCLDLLGQCHAALSSALLTRMCRAFGPLFWIDDAAMEFCPFSCRTHLFALSLVHSFVARQKGLRPVLPRFSSQELTSKADLMAFHFLIEEIVTTMSRSLRLVHEEAGIQPTLTCLRTSEFIQTYSNLKRSRSVRSRRRLKVLNAFISRSPLTQLVYADLLNGGKRETKNAQAVVACLLGPFPEGLSHLQEAWVSAMASALIRSLLSVPSGYALWRSVEKELKRLKKKSAKAREGWLDRTYRELRVNRLARAAHRIEKELDREMRSKMRFLEDIFPGLLTATEQDGLPSSSRHRLLALHIRLADMLVRTAMTRVPSVVAKETDRGLDRQEPGEVFREGGLGLKSLLTILFPWKNGQLARMSPEQREAIIVLIQPGINWSDVRLDDLAQAFQDDVGLTPLASRRLVVRFSTQPTGSTVGGPGASYSIRHLIDQAVSALTPPEEGQTSGGVS